ncbi:MAG: AI-2E family transporter [Salinivirgaceae bacterium]|nr:AI-2E family transporter [Salinivirgaceae bacterium]
MDSRVRYIIGFIGFLLLIFGVWFFRSILAYVLISAAISILGQPIVRMLKKIKIRKRELPNGLTAAISLVSIWFVIILFFRIFIPLIVSEANELSTINVNELYSNLEKPLQEVESFVIKTGHFNDSQSFRDYLTNKIMAFMDASYLSDALSSLSSIFGNLFIAFFAISFITFFFLKESTLFSQGVLMVVPDKHTEEAKRVLSTIRFLLTRYLIGIILEVILVMILVTFGLWLVGIQFQHALICGLFSGIMNVIPYVGPWIGAAFGIIIGIATNIDLPFQPDMLKLIGLMVLVFAAIQTIDNIVFQPFIYSSSVNAHPLEIFLVILMAASIAGIGGMVLAIPSYTVLRVIAKEFLSSFKVVKKLTQNI